MLSLGWSIIVFIAIGAVMFKVGGILFLGPLIGKNAIEGKYPNKLEWCRIVIGVLLMSFAVAPLSAAVENSTKYFSGNNNNTTYCVEK